MHTGRTQFNFYRIKSLPACNAPGLDIQSFDRNIAIQAQQNITEFIIGCIDQDYYVQLYVDEFFIPDRGSYRRRHFIHEILIFGYDGKDQSYDIIGYRRNGDYSSSQVTFSELEQALRSAEQNMDLNYMSYISLFKYKPDVDFDFDVRLVAEQIDDYLCARNTSRRFRLIVKPEVGLYGMDTYESLKDYLQFLRDHHDYADIRPLHILWEHKKCMRLRIQYLETHNYLDASDHFSRRYAQIEQESGTLRMMMLKFKRKGDRALLERIIVNLERISSEESVQLPRIVDALGKRDHA